VRAELRAERHTEEQLRDRDCVHGEEAHPVVVHRTAVEVDKDCVLVGEAARRSRNHRAGEMDSLGLEGSRREEGILPVEHHTVVAGEGSLRRAVGCMEGRTWIE
jgi:hypothetical protein